MTGGPGHGDVTASIDWSNNMFTLNQLTACFVSSMSLILSVVSTEEHASASDAMAIERRCRLLGQSRIVVSTDVVIFRGISFCLTVSWCGVSTVLNPVPLANLNRLQPIARNEF